MSRASRPVPTSDRLFLADPGVQRRRGAAALRAFVLALDRQLGAEWTLVESARWSDSGPASVPQEFDVLALNRELGLIVLEVKAAPISFHPQRGWLIGGTPWDQSQRGGSATPAEQVDRARRNLITGLRALDIAPDRYLSVGRGIAILEGRPWWSAEAAPAPGLLSHEVIVGSSPEPWPAWIEEFGRRLHLRRRSRRADGDAGGLSKGEIERLLASFGFAAPTSAAPQRGARRMRGLAPPASDRPIAFADVLRLWLPRSDQAVILPPILGSLPAPRSEDPEVAAAIAAAAGLDTDSRRRLARVIRQRIDSLDDSSLRSAIATTRDALDRAEIGGGAYAALTEGLDALAALARTRGLKTGLPGGPRPTPGTVALATLKLTLASAFVSPSLAAERIRAAILKHEVDIVVGTLARHPDRFGRLRRDAGSLGASRELGDAIRNLAAAAGRA